MASDNVRVIYKLTTRLVVYIPFVKLLPLRRTGGVGFYSS
jgi:hypothetical protein